MPTTRREFLTVAGLAAAATLLAACSPERDLLKGVAGSSAPTPGPWPATREPGSDATWRALSRLTFGPTLGERARAVDIGLDAWIEEQLAPQSISDTEADLRVRGLDTLQMDTSLLFSVREENARLELQQGALLRAVYSQRQLYEVMVDFWSDHFNVSTLKSDGGWLKTIDDREVIRPHALGKFRDLLWASMHSPAMLTYLDNQENHKGSPNENYARELMELHTLGVGSGYTQRDVQEVARCLTGWTVDAGLFRGSFSFEAGQHDDGTKTVLGHGIPAGGGEGDGERLFEALLSHPANPSFIARKLVRRLVADQPPEALVSAAAATFDRSGGDISEVLKTILHSRDFTAATAKIKRPFHYVAGALRQLDADSDGGSALLAYLGRMGQPLFQRLTPDGYPDVVDAWTSALLVRWQFAIDLLAGKIGGTTLDLLALLRRSGTQSMESVLDRFAGLLLGGALPSGGKSALLGLLGPDLDSDSLQGALGMLLGSPQYQWR